DVKLALPRVTEEVEQVQRALSAALGAVLDVVGDVEHSPEVRRLAALRDGLIEPVKDRHVVELPAPLRVEVPERGVARCRKVLVHLLVDAVQVVDELCVRALAAVDPEEVFCPLWLRLQQVVESGTELLRELPDRAMRLVDQLASVLADQGREVADRV